MSEYREDREFRTLVPFLLCVILAHVSKNTIEKALWVFAAFLYLCVFSLTAFGVRYLEYLERKNQKKPPVTYKDNDDLLL